MQLSRTSLAEIPSADQYQILSCSRRKHQAHLTFDSMLSLILLILCYWYVTNRRLFEEYFQHAIEYAIQAIMSLVTLTSFTRTAKLVGNNSALQDFCVIPCLSNCSKVCSICDCCLHPKHSIKEITSTEHGAVQIWCSDNPFSSLIFLMSFWVLWNIIW